MILIEFLVAAFVVPLVGLMLAQSVEAFALRNESLADSISFSAFDLDGGETAAVLCKNPVAQGILEGYLAGIVVDDGRDLSGREAA